MSLFNMPSFSVFSALSAPDRLHLLIRDITDDFWRRNRGEFLKQILLNSLMVKRAMITTR